MGMSRCYSVMKCLLILFNIIFLCVGVSLCALSGWALWAGAGGEERGARAALGAVCAWGGALAAGAAAALGGAARHSASLLAAAFALLALTGVAEAAAAWWGAAHLPQLQRALHDRLHHSLLHEYGARPHATHALDAIQHGLECCGADGPRDWQGSWWARAAPAPDAPPAPDATLHPPPSPAPLDLSVGAPSAYYWVPASCCVSAESDDCGEARRVPAASRGRPGLHGAGCAGRVLAALSAASRPPLAAAAALLVAHALALLLALALALSLHAHPRPAHKA